MKGSATTRIYSKIGRKNYETIFAKEDQDERKCQLRILSKQMIKAADEMMTTVTMMRDLGVKPDKQSQLSGAAMMLYDWSADVLDED